ncbi:MAG: hypothetical protein EFT35_03770 [Methanophagales archaeon ANME-1-THS]|nr:MAG: hypothetical protein EFT35_03770 [Methanophagales archaeon ANME-1-THS]
MELNKLLDEIIFKEVYTAVEVECKLHYHPSELPNDLADRLKADAEFRQRYKKEVSDQLRRMGHENLEILEIDPASNCVEVRYTAYYRGCREYPEIHLKTLLVLYDEMGIDISDPAIFDTIVDEARRALGEKNKKGKEERLTRFATLFKRALDRETGNE